MIAIGLCGAHRVGKTTLAAQLAQHWQIQFVPTSTSAVFAKFNLKPSQILSFSQRLQIQQHVLDAAVAIWQQASQPFVTDRTPIDFMAYTLADLQGQTDCDISLLESYLDACFTATQQWFPYLAIVQPGIDLVAATGKAALNPAYIEHLNTLVIGLCHDERQQSQVHVVPRRVLSLDDRIQYLDKNMLIF